MKTCNDCVYQPICDIYSDMGITDIPASDTTPCEIFKNKADFVEVRHAATEQTYINGYTAGVKEFAKLLIDKSENGEISVCDVPDFAVEITNKINEAEKKLEILISKHFEDNDIQQGEVKENGKK